MDEQRLAGGVAMDESSISADVLAAISELVGLEVWLLGATARGESRSTFRLGSGLGELLVKLTPEATGALEAQLRLVRVVERLRHRGYPAPEHVGTGRADGTVFTVQRHLPGRTLEPGPGMPPDPAVLTAVLPSILDALELQRDAGDLPDPPWPGWLLDTITVGGEGYCLHETMHRRADTEALLQRLVRIATRNSSGPARTTDVVHFDLNPANILHQAGRLTGIVDWTLPFAGAGQGDRGFDLATLLFYTYDLDATRADLWEATTAISGPEWTAVYLCHLVLRQVEWSARHRPGTPEESRFLDIAHHVLDDCDQRGA